MVAVSHVHGISPAVLSDERYLACSAIAKLLWFTAIGRIREHGTDLTRPVVEEIGELCGTSEHGGIEEFVGELVDQGLWDELTRGESWRIVENGLWTLDPDNEPDILGGDPWS